MCSLKLLAVLFFANCVLADNFFTDCEKPQFEECRIEEFHKFFKEFSAGNNDKGIKPMDPMELGEVIVPEETLDTIFIYKHFKVTGLKDVTVTGFKKGENPDSAHIFFKFDYVAEGPLDVKYTKKDKVLSGTVKYEGGVNGEIKYPYTIKTVGGKVVTEVGQETVICEPVHVKSTIDEELKKTFDSDADAKAHKEQYDKIHKQHQEKVMCETVKAVFKVFVENIRALLHSESQ